MTERAYQVEMFLNQSEWKSWRRSRISGDASSRRYERLTDNARSVILMDDPSRNTELFTVIAAGLREMQLSAPKILAHDPDLGIIILSDLGVDDFVSWLNKAPEDSSKLYRAATDIILHLQNKALGINLQALTPTVGGEMVAITAEYYLGKSAPDLSSAVELAMSEHAPVPDTLALRDFHAENLIWRPSETGFAKVGLLDFQDAFIAPSGYDLVSLLRDARRDVAPNLVEDVIQYFMERSGRGHGFRAQLACLGVQRNLRILGVFARLASQDNKLRYLELLPRVWKNLQFDLSLPALSDLRQAVNDILPEPEPEILKRLGK